MHLFQFTKEDTSLEGANTKKVTALDVDETKAGATGGRYTKFQAYRGNEDQACRVVNCENLILQKQDKFTFMYKCRQCNCTGFMTNSSNDPVP